LNEKKQSTSPDPLEARKRLTFEQAEGLKPLPSQLKRGEISQEFRAVLWAELASELEDGRHTDAGSGYLDGPWAKILKDVHVYRDHRAVDDFPYRYRDIFEAVKVRILAGGWSEVLGLLEFVLKHRDCPDNFAETLNLTMEHCHLAYRVFDGTVICPIGTDAERSAIETAFADLAVSEFNGARAHL